MTRQLTSADMTHERGSFIEEMLRTYVGTDPTLASYAGRIQAGGSLTTVELLKVANTERVATAPAPQLKSGTYTIVNPKTGGHRTVQLRDDDFEWMTSNKPVAGTRVIRGMNGPDNEQSFVYLGTVSPTGVASFTRKSAVYPTLVAAAKWLLAKGVGREAELGKAYAILSGRCCFCNRKLTTPGSVHFGYGPDCADKNGLPWLANPDSEGAIVAEAAAIVARIGFQNVAINPATIVGTDGSTATTAHGLPKPIRTYEELFGSDE